MNDTNQAPSTAVKLMSIVGFIAAGIFLVFLAVQIVKIIPTAFTSLASLADGVNNQPQTNVTVAASESIVNSGESFTVSWTDMNTVGTYTFSYACVDGVSVDVREASGTVTTVACDTPLNLGDGISSLEIYATSEKTRFADVRYEITFTANDSETQIAGGSSVTVVNPQIPQGGLTVDIDEDAEEEVAGESVDADEEDEVATESEEETVAQAPEPTYVETPIYAIPSSNPNGLVDLRVTYSGVGRINRDNSFTRTATFENGSQGAFQFAVKNIGTKTSGVWDFEADLTSGAEYTSSPQLPLKPNEEAILTVGFDAVGDEGFQTFGVVVSGGNDSNLSNNSFSWGVEVTN